MTCPIPLRDILVLGGGLVFLVIPLAACLYMWRR